MIMMMMIVKHVCFSYKSMIHMRGLEEGRERDAANVVTSETATATARHEMHSHQGSRINISNLI